MRYHFHCFKKLTPAKYLLFLASIFIPFLLLLEFGWRTYLYSIGEGFWDNPNEFISSFFTLYEEPAPIKAGGHAYYHFGKVSIEKPPNEIRIICFGGSTTVNRRAGISYTQILEQRFAEIIPDYSIRVLNAGGDGYSSAHTLVNLALRNLELKPDIIVVYHNINDLSVKYFGQEITSDYANKYKSGFYLGFRHRIGLLAELTKVSRLFRSIVSRIDAIAFPSDKYGRGGDSVGRDHRKGLIYFRMNLKSIVSVVKAHGIRIVLTSQPATSKFRNNEGFLAYNQAVRQIAYDENVVFVDNAGALIDDSFFLPDGIHLTREGVERLADSFFSPLNSLVQEVIGRRTTTPNW